MKLGFYTNYDKDVVEFAHKVGFRSMELSAWPDSSLNAEQVTDRRIKEVKKDLKENDIEISALGYYPNYLDPEKEKAEEAAEYFYKVMELATRMGVEVVCTFAGRDPYKSVKENIPLFEKAFTPFCDEAESRGIRIAIENCPMMDRFNLRGENIAFSPEVWDEMYRVVPSEALGIELDPSHMVWQGIDYIQAIYDYGERIYHIHAKDMEINRRVLNRVGILGQAFGEIMGLGHGWWRARLPGWGEIDWPRFITALIEVDYRGNIDIEHEDDVFAAAHAKQNIDTESGIVDAYGREEKGLILGYYTLSKLIPPGE
ncbi:sugar phosphate isomerase/epimerase [Candidatus Bathyarchaeota archaeon]|nr:sugar phosphate isomerase/epimerase [Candidatus Bathyarchaeota archaeon]